ncbi:MAG: type IV secretion system DNA-binding domain-containing protein [Phycisphaerae bacterium]|nr:type IV secretion system DNA-binding domain-containing protein [Phycisphaerae bacterium]
MPTNLSRFLFLVFCCMLVVVFFAAIVLAMKWSYPEGWEAFAGLAFIPTLLFISSIAGRRGRLRSPGVGMSQLWRHHPGFLPAVVQISGEYVIWLFLFPFGTLMGGLLSSQLFGASPVWGWVIVGWLILPFGLQFLLWIFAPSPTGAGGADPEFIRGTAKMSIGEAWNRCQALPVAAGEPRIHWGGLSLPERHSDGHFCIFGATGSGKTVTLRLLMQSILPLIGRGQRGWRALIYDPKNEFWPILSGMGLPCPVITLHPYDTRSARWDIARDINQPSVAKTLATTLIPDPGGQNSFFYQAAQGITSAVMEAFILKAPGRWTLRDVVLTMSDKRTVKRLLKSVPELQHTYDQYFLEDPRTVSNIMMTLNATTGSLRPIAALWANAKVSVSLKDWASSEYILLIAKDKELAEPLDNVNRVLFQRITEILTRPRQNAGRTWVFIDEAKFAGKIPGLDDLLTTGRSFGARVCLATQDVAGLRHAYGPDLAEEILGGAANKAMFGTRSPVTGKYVSEVMGEAERYETTMSETYGEQVSTTESERIVQRKTVLPEQVQQLYPANSQRFYGYYSTPAVGNYEGWVHHARFLYRKGNQPRFIAREASQEYPAPWNEQDRERLGSFLADILMPRGPGERPRQARGTHLDQINLPPPDGQG